jgi:hypothetical protein
MGSCCSTEEDKHDIKIQQSDPTKVKQGKASPKGNAVTKTSQQHLSAETSGESGNILDSVNETVANIYREKGAYEIESITTDSLESRAVTVLENGARYEGQWHPISGERTGKGVQVWADGSMYEGLWENSKANGNGRLIHADGDVYEGEWQDDKAHGKGVYIHTDGARYDGEWKEDRQDGFGVETWPDGAKYEGNYIDGKKDGEGKFFWADGSNYEGQFSDNNIHGTGVYPMGRWKEIRR